MIDNLLKIISEAEVFQLVLFLTLLILILIQIFFKIAFLFKIIRLKRFEPNGEGKPVSILMTVRNEENNLTENLPQLLELDNADYEVVVVDDFSQDNSLSVLGKLKDIYPKLKVSSLNQETRYSAKLSQNIALKSAKNDWVLFLSPSAKQLDKEWFQNLSSCIQEDSDVIINYSNVIASAGLFNLLYRVETFLLYLKSISSVFFRAPHVYFENNVGFKKNKYFELGGYGKKIREPYANLELLINQFVSKQKCQFMLNEKTSVRFSEKVSRHDLFELIKKSFRIEQNLSYSKRILLFIDSMLKILILPLVVFVIILFTGVWPIVLVAVFVLVILHLFIIKTAQNHLNERKIFIPSLVYGLIMPYFKIVYRWHSSKKSRNQNGRAKFKII